MRRWMIGSMLVLIVAAACSTGGGDGTGGGGSNITGAGGSPAAGSTGTGAEVSVPNPCQLLSGADIMKALGDAGYTTTVPDGTLGTMGSQSTCRYQDANGLAFYLDVCSTSACDLNVPRALGGDPVSGVGDDAFFASTCSGPDLLRHDQLWAEAKGLIFTLHIGCHTASTLPQPGNDQALTALMQLAISRA